MSIASINKFLVKIFGSRNERLVKSYLQLAAQSSEFEPQMSNLTDEQLKEKTAEFKSRIASGTDFADIVAEAFAVVRETAKRKLQMRHYDVQLVGGRVLFEGRIAEMSTGEGKTLVATLAAYMVYLTGRKVHVVTVNDYLAKRDSEWMSPVYNSLGLSVGAIQASMDTSGDERKAQYACDITYGTNNEFGFDYLRDNMKISAKQLAQGPLDYAIIDEVDSILIDEARTPLIISGPAFDDVTRYKKADAIARKIIQMQGDYDRITKAIDSDSRALANAQGELSDAKKSKDADRINKAQLEIERLESKVDTYTVRLESAQQYYEVEYDRKSVNLNHDGIGAAQDLAGIGSFFTGSNMEWPHLINQSLRAHIVFEREKEYVVMGGKVVIVDEFTGRLMEGRQWSDGLHQAVEAKENVQVKEESQTLATITLQNFFKLYGQIAGMTGTAATEAGEFMQIYKLEVVTMPTNKPCIRDDRDDMIYKSLKEKFDATVEDIHEHSSVGKPVLVGTISVEKSEAISIALSKKFGTEHEVLNAKQHAREATIVEKAGGQYTDRNGKLRGNVTIATNMAGRGTDIKLAEGVADLGGLHIVGTERHESRRIDNQLRGRAGRQGDNGSSQFFLCFEDDLMRIFAPDWTMKALSWVKWEEGMPIQLRQISKGIERAQRKVEQRNFEARKSLLEYDEVNDFQRSTYYARRRQIINGIGLREMIDEMVDSVLEINCRNILAKDYPYTCISEWAAVTFGVNLEPGRISGMEIEDIEMRIKKLTKSEASTNISIQLGEYLEDFEDRSTWKIDAMCKWAMSSFSVSLSGSKVRQMTANEIEHMLIEASAEQIDKKDCSQIGVFLAEEFGRKTFVNWANNKFDLKITIDDIDGLTPDEIQQRLSQRIKEKYAQREIEYPVEFAMARTFGSSEVNIYAFESLAQWVKNRYGKEISPAQLQGMTPAAINQELLTISHEYNECGLANEISDKVASLDSAGLLEWAKQRFDADLDLEQLTDKDAAVEQLTDAGKAFLRAELGDLERYVLLQIFDGVWKDHLYAMDHMKESIFLRSYAEKDPKLEYKQEGYRMFSEMLDTLEEKVTDTIFKVRLDPGTRAKSVWNVDAAKHDEVNQFSISERQRAAAQAPQGEARKVKQIKLESPKVGRNDPCPCGSGKKYKKCCGSNV